MNDMVHLRACYWTTKQDPSTIHHIREGVVNSDQLLEVEFDENSLRGVLDKYHWYPIAITREYSLYCKWNCEIRGGGVEANLPPINDVR